MFSLGWFATITASTLNLILGLGTYIKNPKSATNRFFAIFAFTLSTYLLFNQLSLLDLSPNIQLLWMRLVMVIATLLNLAYFLLVTHFPTTQIKYTAKQLSILMIITLIMSSIALTPLLFTGIDTQNFKPKPGPAMPLFLLHTILLLGGGFVSLLKKYTHERGIIKSQIILVLGGTITMFLLILLTNVAFVFIFNISSFVGLLPLYTIIFTTSVSYAIIKHRFLDISLLLFRAVSFSILTIIIIFVYALGLFSLVSFINDQYHTVISIILALIMVYTYNPLRHLIENLTKNIFYKNSYSLQQLLESLGKIIRSNIALKSLTTKVLKKLTTTLHITKAAFIIIDEKDIYTVDYLGYSQKPNLTHQTIDILATTAKKSLLIFEELPEGKIKDILRDHQISIVIPLTVKNTKHGLLVMGEKASGEIYNTQDIQVLEIFTPQISIAIQNALSFDQIKRFNITLKEEVDKATTDLKKANRHLRHLDKLKDDFVFIATHELKNPVAAMKGYLSLLKEGIYGDIPKKIQDPLTQLDASTQQLVQLVNDLLAIARSEAKTLTISTEPVNLCVVIDALCAQLKPLIDQKQLKLQHACPTKIPQVKADPDKLKEIINNLVSNAIKYSDQGVIVISHVIENGMVITHVKDQGVGISPENQKKLFTRFFRAEEEAAKGIPGTGLGLFIVKQLVEKMGGRIWFTSKKDQGSTFSFSLPIA